ncbi:hypothetical protein SAMN04488107_1641, partial [Geodermatophilus saharensis]
MSGTKGARKGLGRPLIAVVALAAIATLLVGLFPKTWPRDAPPPASAQGACGDETLRDAEITTTLTLSADYEEPFLSADTEISLPKDWQGAAGLTRDPASEEYRAAIQCLLPIWSTAYRANPPTVEVEPGAHGDIVVSDYVDNENTATIPADLGLWAFSYGHEPNGYCPEPQAHRVDSGQLLAVICPPYGTLSGGTWTINLRLDGVRTLSSAFEPHELHADGTASYQLEEGVESLPGAAFWLELQPSPAAGSYLALQEWHDGVAIAAMSQNGWLLLFALLLLSARGLRSSVIAPRNPGSTSLLSGPRGPSILLARVSSLGILTTLVITLADVAYALNVDKSPATVSARLESVALYALVTLIATLGWRGWFRLIAVAAVTGTFLVAYFGPRRVTLETAPTNMERGELVTELRLLGYLNHVLLAIAAFALIFAMLLRLLIASHDELGGGSRWVAPIRTRARRVIVALLLASGIAGHWLWVEYVRWDRAGLIPGRSHTTEQLGDALLGRLPWLPDHLLHWLPPFLYYAALSCAIVVLASRCGHRQADPLERIAPDLDEFRLVTLIFAAAVVGTYGSYRAISFPLAFLAAIVFLYLLKQDLASWAQDSRLLSVPSGVYANFNDLQKDLLLRSREASLQERRNQAMEARYERGHVTPAVHVQELGLREVLSWYHHRTFEQLPSDPSETDDRRLSDQELAISLGPCVDWWSNAVYAARVGLVLAVPVVAYDGYIWVHSGTFDRAWQLGAGFLDVVHWMVPELLIWLTASFSLGAFWTLIPGRRGIIKGLLLGAVVVLADSANGLLARLLGQASFDIASWGLLVTSYLAVLG